MCKPSSESPLESPPETPYVALMLQILAQARAQQYTESAPLQIVIWLAYRVLDINARNAHAYTVLAYLFCLLGETQRGLMILNHFKHMHKSMHMQTSFAEDHPVEVLQKVLQSQASASSALASASASASASSHFAIAPAELALPTLAESLNMLEQASLPVFQANMERGLPAINRLLGHLESTKSHDSP